MIPAALLEKARKIAYDEATEYRSPAIAHLDLANAQGQRLAKRSGAREDIVLLGTLLMDCMLGRALAANAREKHIDMSAGRTQELISEFPEVTEGEKQNVLSCVREHHGAPKFSTLEAEVCCNADCYRFASVAGILAGVRGLRDMERDELVKLCSDKADEKWNALTLAVCKRELEPQYRAIKEFLANYRG